MTVKELIQLLETFDPDHDVRFRVEDKGDYPLGGQDVGLAIWPHDVPGATFADHVDPVDAPHLVKEANCIVIFSCA